MAILTTTATTTGADVPERFPDSRANLHRGVLRHHPKGQPKKADLIAALALEISKEIESRNQHAEPHAELPGVPVSAPVDVIDADLLKITLIEPIPGTQTSLEPTPMGGKDGV